MTDLRTCTDIEPDGVWFRCTFAVSQLMCPFSRAQTTVIVWNDAEGLKHAISFGSPESREQVLAIIREVCLGGD